MTYTGTIHGAPDASFGIAAAISAYKAVKLTAQNTVAIAGAGEAAIGITTDEAEASEGVVSVRMSGPALAIAGGTITVNAKLKVDANGDLVATTTGTDLVVAYAMEPAADNDEFEVYILPVPVLYSSFA